MLIPTRGKLIVENIKDDRRTSSGLYIADKIEEIPHKGKIIAIGLKYRDDKGKEKDWHFSVGEIVHFKRNWTSQKAEYFILKRDEIIAVESGSFRAVMDMIIIKRHYINTIAGGSIVIPDSYGAKQNHSDFYGEVFAEGPESKFNFKKGDKIIYSRDEGSSFIFKDQEYFSLKPRAVLARLED